MNKELFLNQIQRLSDIFGEKYFPAERIEVTWNKCKHEEDEQFVRAVNKIILDKIHVPSANEIISYTINERTLKTKPVVEFKFDCSWCGQSGFVTAKHKNNKPGDYAFKCKCKLFSSRARGTFPEWSSDWAFDLVPDFYCFQNPGENPYKIEHKTYEATPDQKELLKSFLGE